MSMIAAALMFALAQDGTTTDDKLTDAETAVLGGFAAERLDSPTDELEAALRGKMEEIRKARAPEKKEEAPKGKKRKKGAKKPAAASPDTIKNGLTEADRLALGKVVLSEISAGHKGEELSGPLKKELERLRAERVKSSSSSEAPKKKKKKKANA